LRLPEDFTSAFLVFGNLLAALLALFERVVRFGCGEISLTGGSNPIQFAIRKSQFAIKIPELNLRA
jgi:hypothetical protein